MEAHKLPLSPLQKETNLPNLGFIIRFDLVFLLIT